MDFSTVLLDHTLPWPGKKPDSGMGSSMSRRDPYEVAAEVARARDGLEGVVRGSFGIAVIFRSEVVKISCYPSLDHRVCMEKDALQSLDGADVFVPRLMWEWKDPYLGPHFSATRTAGICMHNAHRNGLPPRHSIPGIARGIAKLTHVFGKAVSPDAAKEMIVEQHNVLRGTAGLTDKLSRFLGSDITARAFNAVAENEGRFSERPPRILHADIHPWNVMVSSMTAEYTGTIDFGCLKLGAPEEAFQKMYDCYGSTHGLVGTMCADYSRLSGETVTMRNVILCEIEYLVKCGNFWLHTGDEMEARGVRDRMAKELDALQSFPRAPVVSVPGRKGP